MIDIWLIFNLIVPFVYMIIHTYMDTLRQGMYTHVVYRIFLIRRDSSDEGETNNPW